MDEITKWRRRIDEIDEHLIVLLNERAASAIEIGKIKQKKEMEIRNPEREKNVFDHIKRCNKGPLSNAAIQNLYEHIIAECIKIESDLEA